MINSADVESQGFKPLKKTQTEPVSLPSKPMMNRGMSFNAETGEKESAHNLWEGSSWEKLGRRRGKTMDRANSFVGGPAEVKSTNDGVVAVVDPFSTGAHLSAQVCKLGYKCAKILSAWDSPVASLVQHGINADYIATLQYDDRLSDTEVAVNQVIDALKEIPFPIIAIIPGAETGVELADQLSHRMGLRSNGVDGSLARRNKYDMGEKVRNAGVRAVKQALCKTDSEVRDFVATLSSKKCVVKPVQSAGSDDVFLCNELHEAITAFNRICGSMNGLGMLNHAVLVQEFLIGKEYVVDKVSRDGVHKVVGIWEYEKRPVNGAAFVYFGMRLKDPNTKMAQVMIAYADLVLNALDIKQGPSHMEIMLNTIKDDATGEVLEYDPCLVEVGARCQGGEGTWLGMARECIGYTQVDATLDVYLDGKLFDSIDKDTYPKRKACRELDMVSRQGGIVRRLPGDKYIRSRPTFRGLTWEVKPGEYIPKTIDCFTRPGCVQLVGDTEEQVEKDFEDIHDQEELNMIDYSVICPKPPLVGAVVVIDPFSSGANIAAMVLLWGYKLILVFSEKDSPVANLVSTSAKVESTLMIQHDNTHPDQAFARSETVKQIEAQGSPILAIIPGAETGVELADLLASSYGTRSNGMDLGSARRNKFLMQEELRTQGKIRTIMQRLCCTEDEVKSFLSDLKDKSPSGSLKCVVKPNESAGTDSVFLCSTEVDAVGAFHAIHHQINGLGQLNEGALVQEYLVGTEFAVDGISRDGVYKILAVWEYDKRSVNGANFVYHGMFLRDGTDPRMRAVMEYAKEVVAGLKIVQGPSHMEIICTDVTGTGTGAGTGGDVSKYSPCLIEVGTRCHGGEGSWVPVAAECLGYTQLDATLNCYLRPDRFDALPPEPTLVKFGCEAFLVSHNKGTLKEIIGIDKVRGLQSFRKIDFLIQPGAQILPTIDCFTRPGSVQMVSKTREGLLADYDEIRKLERDGLFELL